MMLRKTCLSCVASAKSMGKIVAEDLLDPDVLKEDLIDGRTERFLEKIVMFVPPV
jgi:hypothetical protein